jgi:hypothetical protein
MPERAQPVVTGRGERAHRDRDHDQAASGEKKT